MSDKSDKLKTACFDEGCELDEATAKILNPDGVVEEVPLSELPELSDDPWWVRLFYRLFGPF
jgi:hypothetical protein